MGNKQRKPGYNLPVLVDGELVEALREAKERLGVTIKALVEQGIKMRLEVLKKEGN